MGHFYMMCVERQEIKKGSEDGRRDYIPQIYIVYGYSCNICNYGTLLLLGDGESGGEK